MSSAQVSASFAQFGVHLPMPSADVLAASPTSRPLLVTAIPLGIYNFTEGMNNVESASAAGDNYSLRHILLADGMGAVVGSLLGEPIPAGGLYRPSRLEGGRRPDRLFAGDRRRHRLVCFLGLTALLLAVVPLVAATKNGTDLMYKLGKN